ncbi:hypothetical protein QAD02_013354 [Eretmocerus hayati]|uniref:Uncharacterized protein n=1 Tax=Eretmocerus hayati TaxID=131215 RepID=A0ACC2P2G7_9HYME|nr:hypothetical protein QAD02_013354 [Eretmocerus hayati]
MQSDIHRLPGSLKLLERKATYNGNELEKLIEESDAKLTVIKTVIDTVMNRIEELEDDVSDLKKYNHEINAAGRALPEFFPTKKIIERERAKRHRITKIKKAKTSWGAKVILELKTKFEVFVSSELNNLLITDTRAHRELIEKLDTTPIYFVHMGRALSEYLPTKELLAVDEEKRYRITKIKKRDTGWSLYIIVEVEDSFEIFLPKKLNRLLMTKSHGSIGTLRRMLQNPLLTVQQKQMVIYAIGRIISLKLTLGSTARQGSGLGSSSAPRIR